MIVKTILIYLGLVLFTLTQFNLKKQFHILRRIRRETVGQQSAAEEQIDLIRSNYPYQDGGLEQSIKQAEDDLPRLIAWVKDILRDYKTKFGGGKLVFLGGACKKAYQAAKLFSVQYGIPNEKIIYLDLPRRIVEDILDKYQDEGLEKFLAQEGILSGDEPAAFIDVCIDTYQEYDPVIHIARVIKKFHPQVPVYAGLIMVRGLGLTEEQISFFAQEPEEYVRREGLFDFLEYSPRYRQPDTVVDEEGKLVLTYRVKELASSYHFPAQNILTYYALAKELSLISQSNDRDNWSNYIVDLMANIGRPVSIEELRRSLGITHPEDHRFFNQEMFFTQAVSDTLKALVSSGRINKAGDTYCLP